MTTAYTSLLGLALPVTGELDGTWGDTVNNYITSYLDAAVEGTQTISGSQTAVTLSVTTNASLSQAGSGSTGSAQYQIINCTGNPASLLTITVPASSRQYIVINATSTSQSVKVVGVGPTTGVTMVSGEKAHIAWNGSDFVKVASTVITNLTGTLPIANGGTGQTSASAAFNALSPITTTGDLIIGNGSNSATRLAIGSNGTVLTSNGTTASWASVPAGDVTAAGNNAFTGANTFYNATGQTFAPATANDGIVLQGRAGGSSSYRVTFTTTTLSGSRTITLPDANINFATGLGVANGGTGLSTTTAYALLAAGTTSTGNFQQVSGTGTSGQVLTSNGAGALPTWQTAASSGTTIGLARAISINCILP